MGALDAVLSFGNRARRNLRDIVHNPLAVLEQYAGQLRDDAPKSVRESVQRTFNPTEEDLQAAQGAWNPAALGKVGHALMAGVVKPKGGNWLAGSVEDALRGLKLQPLRAPSAGVDQPLHPNSAAINQWIEGPLTKYVETRMASPDDEVRRLAEQGVLHFEPREMYNMERGPVSLARTKAGFLASGVAENPLAARWEGMADAFINAAPVKHWRPNQELAAKLGDDYLSKIAVKDPETPIYQIAGQGGDTLGFPHLIDELSNALNPASGLPRNLLLTPEAMKQLSMEKAVRRVADINAWRAAQKVEANRKLAEQASLVREYAENNPKGLRWVELREAEAKLPEGYTVHPDPKNEGYVTIVDPQGRIAMGGATEQEAIGLLNRQERRQALADQLKYEGDTMGHCVGGYCDAVLSGRSRIFSLRDAKGEPHVTIETRNYDPEDLAYNHDFWAREDVRAAIEGLDPTSDEFNRVVNAIAKKDHPRPSIVQIKGKQNRAPNEEYLPFVQDFVRNSPLGGQWSDVGDLQNTGLRRTIDAFNSAELRKIQEAGIDVPFHATQQDINAIRAQVWPNEPPLEGFAQGGSVAPSETNQAIIPASWDVFFTE